MLGFGGEEEAVECGEVARVVLVVIYIEYAAYTPFTSDLDGGDVGAVDGECGPAVGRNVSVDEDDGSGT